ncbi:MAG: glycosyltransferase [Chloroflexota bacterium]
MPNNPARILSFVTHESHTYELAKTGFEFELLVPPTMPPWRKAWDARCRPLPRNVRITTPAAGQTVADLAAHYDLVLCHTLEQFELVEHAPVPRILNLLTHSIRPDGWPASLDFATSLGLRNRLNGTPIVYIGESARRDWRLRGTVIRHGVDRLDHLDFPWRGDVVSALTVCHHLYERGEEKGAHVWDFVHSHGVPIALIGDNPEVEGAHIPPNWDALRGSYASHRAYLNTTPHGGSRAMLEAALVGCPIVTRPRRDGTSIFTDGESGMVAEEPAEIVRRIETLLADPSLGRRIGAKGRAVVESIYDSAGFVDRWARLIEATLGTEPPLAPVVDPPADDDFFRCSIELVDAPSSLPADTCGVARMRVTNQGQHTWLARTRGDHGRVSLAYHVLTPDGRELVRNGWSTWLPQDLAPGASVILDCGIRAPKAARDYVIRWDLVSQAVSWFSERGGQVLDTMLRVR